MILNYWNDWQPATCRPDHCFCEAVRDGIVAQPANTWSNLGFVVIGLLIAHSRVPGNAMARYRRLFGYSMVVIGLGSAFYHASLTFAGQLMDVSGMYILITFALVYSLNRLYGGGVAGFVFHYVALNVLLFALQFWLPGTRRYVFFLLVIGVLGAEIYRRRKVVSIESKWLLYATATMAIGFAIWVLDITKTVCAPRSWIQGHAIWHLLGAVAAFFLYRYYRSEVNAAASRSGL